MFFISHRGNLYGPNKKEENKIDYINEAIKKKFDVEIDLWFKKDKFYLGHDEPQYEVNINFLKNKKLWIHAKNLDCFYELSKYDLNFFWHEKDKIVITSKDEMFVTGFGTNSLYKIILNQGEFVSQT